MREDRGMRPRKDGVPKIILTITDGLSDNPKNTKLQADRIRKREFNMISVGVGEADLTELFVISSTPNDQYYVDDFGKILDIINDITVTTCQQPALIEEETDIVSKVEKDVYKYFKYPVPTSVSSNQTVLDEFTIVMEQVAGSSELYYSFEEKNPKSESDYIKDSDPPGEKDENFYEDPEQGRSKPSAIKHRSVEVVQTLPVVYGEPLETRYYLIKNPNASETLYFSLIGKEEENEVQVHVYNRTVPDPNPSTTPGTTTPSSASSLVASQFYKLVCATLLILLLRR